MTTRTLLGPQKIIYTPPPSCFTPILEYDDNSDLTGYIDVGYGKTCSGGTATVDAQNCYPPEHGSYVVSKDRYGTVPMYSPGTACPGGWTAACSITQSGQQTDRTLAPAERNLLSVLASDEVATGCCPSGWTCGDLLGMHCVTTATSGQVITGETFTGSCATSESKLTVSSSVTTDIGTAYRVILLNTATETPDSGDDGGLSTGSKIGIGVSVPVGVILIVGVVLFFFWRKRRAKNASPSRNNGPPPNAPGNGNSGVTAALGESGTDGVVYGMGKPELENSQVNAPQPISELGQGVHNNTAGGYSELDSSATARHELEAHSRPR